MNQFKTEQQQHRQFERAYDKAVKKAQKKMSPLGKSLFEIMAEQELQTLKQYR